MTEEGSLLTAGAEAAQASDTPPAATAAQTPAADASKSAEAAAPKWTEALPDELKGAEVLGKYADQNAALKALVDAQKLLGKRAEGLVPPGEDAKPEEVEAFNAKLRELRGVPDAPDKYEVVVPEGAPEGYALDPGLVSYFQGIAHEAGMAPAEFTSMANAFMAREIESITAMRQQAVEGQKKAEAELVKQWQTEGLAPKEGFTRAHKAAQMLGLVGKDFDLLGSLGNNTKLIAQLEKVYPTLSESGLKGGATSDSEPALTPKEALARGRAMMRDPRYADPARRDPVYVQEVEAHFAKHGGAIAGAVRPR